MPPSNAPPALGAPIDVLLLATHPPDFAGFRAALSDTIDGTIGGIRVVGKSVGIGAPSAAANSAIRLMQGRPRCAIFVGTCAVYPNLPEYRPTDVLIASRLVAISVSALQGQSAFPDPMQLSIDGNASLNAGISSSGLRTHTMSLASPYASTTSDAVAQTLASATGCHGENLEAFAFATACRAIQIPFACVLGATHIAGSTAQVDWKQFHRPAAVAAAEAVVSWLHNGAPGMPHR